VFVDATLGGGGYTLALLERVRPGGSVLALDRDPDRKSTRLNSSHPSRSRMPSSA